MNNLLFRRSGLAGSACALLGAFVPPIVLAATSAESRIAPVSSPLVVAQSGGAATASAVAGTTTQVSPAVAPMSSESALPAQPAADIRSVVDAPAPIAPIAPSAPFAPSAPVAQRAPVAGAAADAGATADAGARPTQAIVVAPIFEQPGVLTPTGKYVVEPSLQYGYSSSNRVSLIGYSIIPAILIGLIDVREVKRNTLTAALTGRFGVTNRFEVEGRVPYVYRSDATVSREFLQGSSTNDVFDATGRALGDIELAARYQLNEGGADKPFYVATMRFKSRTGRDPFQVVTNCAVRCVANSKGTGLPLDLPTGSGFYSLQPGVTWLYPSDPAVFFGSFTYSHNFKRSNVSRAIVDGSEFLGTVAPGDIFGFNFGMGLALNEKASFSIGYDHNTVGRTKLNGVTIPGSVRSQLGTLLVGYAFRINPKTSLSLSFGAGLTRDTPDVTLTVRLPMSF